MNSNINMMFKSRIFDYLYRGRDKRKVARLPHTRMHERIINAIKIKPSPATEGEVETQHER